MNKLFKGAIAGAAGVALLLGGAGTFALWNHAAPVGTDATIDAGHLGFGNMDDLDGEWTLNGEDIDDIADVALVPGDVFAYRLDDVPIVAHGDYLAAEFGITWDGPLTVEDDQHPMTLDGASGEFADALDIDYKVSVGDEPTKEASGRTITVDIPGRTDMKPTPVDVVVNFTFDPETLDQLGMGGRVDLQGFQLTLEQVPAAEHLA